MSQGIRGLNFSTRARNILREEGIATIPELQQWASEANRKHLSIVHGLGPKTLAEIRFALYEAGRSKKAPGILNRPRR